MALIADRPLCLPCVSGKTGVKQDQIEVLLARIKRRTRVRRLPKARCRECGQDRPTVSIDAPA